MSGGHTPGEWFVADGGVCAREMPADGGNVVCLSPETVMAASLAKWPSNARLIAAAPDLLAALVTLVNQRDCHFHTAQAWDDARAAISRTKTGEPA